ncbi:sensor histidine kinase [Mucilaginibacter ginsenosidivorans]|uniref:histidine kinase n=1 Tax=Mucilaginibacter ginsenosidivorans TaxID=398053 RepID=A0A5B8UT05_9SPHI|nr:ATP-binding protein [Mucilaginibacter ginsenosidivorans]QEC62240.1 GHKL domain-containing protein [Mucilaginibacter ginsenosidivorans]
MSFFYFLTAFLLVRRINKRLKGNLYLYPKWRNMIIMATWGTVGLFIGSWFLEEQYQDLIGATALLGLAYYGYKEEDLRVYKVVFQATYPLIAIGYINAIAKIFFGFFFEKGSNDQYFVFAVIAAFIWTFARWATTKKQEEALRISAERRAELEVLVGERTTELQRQKEELQEALRELKTTQTQLIQSEKMASLGELTAGIAHEIQNPLNFVNNFSEVSAELIDEMEEELKKGDVEEAMAIANDIKQNLEKIRHHGKRADGIVKGMLQHSRASSDVKEPTDINKLADEYLRLAYHGLRAKDKSFNSELVTHFAEGLPKAEMVPQDIGRVLLNLFNNAFYAVQKRHLAEGNAFKPTVTVTTAAKAKRLEITVRDNGTGIPDNIKDKILQPFFTTKPTGEGTGLGLSLSYDIVVKGHNGKIDVKSKEGEFTEFQITLPV